MASARSLNPYSIGIWSATNDGTSFDSMGVGLNPYSIGIWSATGQIVVVDFAPGLNPYSIGIWSATG